MRELNSSSVKDPAVKSLFREINSQVRKDETYFKVTGNGVFVYNIKSGATQVAADAVAGELWKTDTHATLPDNVIMIGV